MILDSSLMISHISSALLKLLFSSNNKESYLFLFPFTNSPLPRRTQSCSSSFGWRLPTTSRASHVRRLVDAMPRPTPWSWPWTSTRSRRLPPLVGDEFTEFHPHVGFKKVKFGLLVTMVAYSNIFLFYIKNYTCTLKTKV